MYLTHLLWMNCKHSKQCNIYKDLHEDLRVSVVVIASSLRKASCRRAFATHPPSEKALSTVEVRRLHCWADIPPSWINSIFAPLGASISCYERGRLVLISTMTMRGGPFDFWLGVGVTDFLQAYLYQKQFMHIFFRAVSVCPYFNVDW